MIIRECGVWSDKYIVRNSNAIPKLNTGFYGYSVTNRNIVFNENAITDIAVFPDYCAFEDM